jgi:hypothetical protein
MISCLKYLLPPIAFNNTYRSDDRSDSSGGDEEGQACGDDIYADIPSVAPLEQTSA